VINLATRNDIQLSELQKNHDKQHSTRATQNCVQRNELQKKQARQMRSDIGELRKGMSNDIEPRELQKNCDKRDSN
jgi:hypothetical protein